MMKQKLNITFHNPGGNDELLRLLVKIIAQQRVDELIKNKLHIQKPQV